MANKGETKSQKSISAPKVRQFLRKANVFTVKSRPGPHSKETSVPLSFAMRTLLGATENLKETKKVISNGDVKVNAKIRKDYRFAVGIFDTIELVASKKKYRAILDRKGRLQFVEIDIKSKDFKVSKIVSKKAVKGNKTWITTNDGFTIDIGKEKISVGDSIKVSLPEGKIEEIFPMAKGNSIFIIGGTHVGKTIKISDITEGTGQRKKLISLVEGDKDFQTVAKNVFVVGKDKPALEVLEAK